jgi:DME family drug/metabolite transporter
VTKNVTAGAVVAVLVSATLFGTTGTARLVSGVEAQSVTIAAIRLLVGAAGLVVISLVAGRSANLMALWRRPLVWVMGVGVAAYQALFFVGTGLVGVAVGTLASLALGPLMAGLLAWALGGSRPSRVWWLSTLIAIVGLSVLTFGGVTSDASFNVVGILAAVGAGSAYAVYTVLGGRLAAQSMPATDVLAASFLVGAVLLLPLGAAEFSALNSGSGIALVVWLGVIATTLAYVLFGRGITHLTPGTVATLNLAEPVVATILGVVVVHETISGLSLVGCGLIAMSLSVLAVSTVRSGK